jgi:hypothetical protein
MAAAASGELTMNLRNLILTCTLLAIAGGARTTLLAAEGGTLKGRFVYGGKSLVQKPLEITADKAFCGAPERKKHILDESLVVGKDGALANVFFWMDKKPAGAVHPFYAAKAKEKVVLNNLGCRFEPHVIGLWTDQTITITNKDTVGHNTNIAGLNGKSINPLIPAGGMIDETFKVSERLPLQVSCNLHPWMRSRLLIKDHPYFAISDAQGNFEIKHIPAGEYDFRIYHETLLYLKDVKVGSGVTSKQGIVKIKIEEGKTHDLGVVKVPEAKAAPK